MTVKLAVIGAGAWGSKLIKTLSRAQNMDLRWVVSCRPETEAILLENCQRLPTIDALLAQKEQPSGVVIATPPEVHYDCAVPFIRRHIPCFIEKPVTMDSDQSQALMVLADRHKTLVQVNHIYLYHHGYRQLKALLRQEQKPLKKIETIGGNYGPFDRSTPVLWDWLPHDLSMVLDLLSETPTTLSVTAKTPENPAKKGQIFQLDMTFPSGAVVCMKIGNGFACRQRQLKVSTEQDSFTFCDESQPTLKRNNQPLSFPDGLPLDHSLTLFGNDIKAGNNTLSSLKLGHKIVQIIESLYLQ